MILPTYVLLQAEALNGPGLILCTREPFYLGRIIKNQSTDKHAEYLAQSRVPIVVGVPGYNIAIVWAGTLRGNRIDVTPDTKHHLKGVFDQMARFFYQEKIEKHQKHYAGWLQK